MRGHGCSLMLRRTFLERFCRAFRDLSVLDAEHPAHTAEHSQNFEPPRAGASLATFPLELYRKMHSSLKDVIPPNR